MKFNIISNKTILSFCLLIVLCLLSSSTSFAAAAAVAAPSNPGATTAIPGSAGLLRGSGSSGTLDHHDRQRLLPGSCRTQKHPYRTYCQTMCYMFITTAHCIASNPICKGCKWGSAVHVDGDGQRESNWAAGELQRYVTTNQLLFLLAGWRVGRTDDDHVPTS
jgi:hypothetical protein